MGSKLILLSKKIKNFVFFKIPSFKIDNILGGSCPHLWVCNPPTRKWPKFFLDERPLYEHCVPGVLRRMVLFRSPNLIVYNFVAHEAIEFEITASFSEYLL